MKKAKCRTCNTEFLGRTNQFFCSIDCKNEFHNSKNLQKIDFIEITPDDFQNFQEKYRLLTSNYQNKVNELQTEQKKYEKLKSAYRKMKEQNAKLEQELSSAKQELLTTRQNMNQAATLGVKNLISGLLGG